MPTRSARRYARGSNALPAKVEPTSGETATGKELTFPLDTQPRALTVDAMKPLPNLATPFNAALARALGLRFRVEGDGAFMPDSDWRLYQRALNPRSAVSFRWLQHSGNRHLWIGGIDTYSDEPWDYLGRLAEACPDVAHFAEWRDRFAPEVVRRDMGQTPLRD